MGYNARMSSTNPQTISVDGVTLTLLIERKRVKNINARLRESTLSVSVPLHTPQATLDQVIPDLARRLVRRVRARQVNAEEDALTLANKIAARFPNRPGVAHVYPDTDRADAFLAGVSWLGRRWEELPPVERALLTRVSGCGDEGGKSDEIGD